MQLRQGLAAVAVRPWLWPTAVVQVFRLAAPGWWRRRPFLPLPDRHYLAFRMQAMYGDATHPPEARHIVSWLDWCRRHSRLVR